METLLKFLTIPIPQIPSALKVNTPTSNYTSPLIRPPQASCIIWPRLHRDGVMEHMPERWMRNCYKADIYIRVVWSVRTLYLYSPALPYSPTDIYLHNFLITHNALTIHSHQRWRTSRYGCHISTLAGAKMALMIALKWWCNSFNDVII